MPQLLPGIEQADFICGCGHSGTTLLATILAVHPQLYVPLRETEAFLCMPEEAASRLQRVAWEAHAAHKKWVVEKTPRHIRRIGTIRRVVPRARFIILVRDGRDVVASLAHRFEGNFWGSLKRWVEDTGIAQREAGKPDVLIVRYEDLVDDPPGEISRVCEFMGVPYEPELLDYHKKQHLWQNKTVLQQTDGVGERHQDLRNWQVNQPIFDGRGHRRATLPPEILAEFGRGRVHEIMQAFGYARTPQGAESAT